MTKTTASNVHAHIDTESQDCDSRYTNCYIMRVDPDLDQREDYEGDGEIAFRGRVVAHIVSGYTTVYGTLKVEGNEDTGVTERLTWHESTEEGYRAADVRFCYDEYCVDETLYRDHTAESMGY